MAKSNGLPYPCRRESLATPSRSRRWHLSGSAHRPRSHEDRARPAYQIGTATQGIDRRRSLYRDRLPRCRPEIVEFPSGFPVTQTEVSASAFGWSKLRDQPLFCHRRIAVPALPAIVDVQFSPVRKPQNRKQNRRDQRTAPSTGRGSFSLWGMGRKNSTRAEIFGFTR